MTPEQTPDSVKSLADALGLRFLIEVGILIVGVARDLGDPDLRLLELVSQIEDLVHRDGGTQDGLQYPVLGVLDSFRQRDLALAGEERDRDHPAQVHADGIVVRGIVGIVGRGGGFGPGHDGFRGRGRLFFFQLWCDGAHWQVTL